MHQIQKRQVLEEAELLDARISALEEDLDEVESSEEEDEDEEKVLIIGHSKCKDIHNITCTFAKEDRNEDKWRHICEKSLKLTAV